MAWGWRTGLRSQPGPSRRLRPEHAVSRAADTDSAQSDADWADPVVGAADQGMHHGDSQADRDRDRPRGCSDSNARKRAHDSTTSHLTTRPHDTQHIIRWPVTLCARGTTRGVQPRRVRLLFSCPPSQPGRRLLSRAHWVARVEHLFAT
jgi:hypothetical protein